MLEMILKIDGTVGNFPTLKEFRESGEGLTVGGFCFRVQVNGKMLDVNYFKNTPKKNLPGSSFFLPYKPAQNFHFIL